MSFQYSKDSSNPNFMTGYWTTIRFRTIKMVSRITRKKPPTYVAVVVIMCFLVALQMQYNVSTTHLVSQKLMQRKPSPVLVTTTNAMPESREKETALLITTNWIPSAPSPALLIEVINSIELMF